MSETIPNLMRANLLEVFNERDETRRLAAIDRIHAEDVVFSDHNGTAAGRTALNESAGKLLERMSAFVFSPDGPAYEVNNLGYQAWQLGPEGQPPVVKGIDIALVKDGRITALYVILKNE